MESGEFQIRPVECPDCGAPFPWDKPSCWLCGWKLGDPVTPGRKAQFRPKIIVETQPSHDNLTRTFSLSTIFLWMTLVSVVMGVVRVAPGLGFGVAIISLPAALRTMTSVHRRKKQFGETMTVVEKISTFLGWAVAVMAVGAAAVAAFWIAMYSICLFTLGGILAFEYGFALPAILAVGFAVVCLWKMWHREDTSNLWP